jgi:hypothetical protein
MSTAGVMTGKYCGLWIRPTVLDEEDNERRKITWQFPARIQVNLTIMYSILQLLFIKHVHMEPTQHKMDAVFLRSCWRLTSNSMCIFTLRSFGAARYEYRGWLRLMILFQRHKTWRLFRAVVHCIVSRKRRREVHHSHLPEEKRPPPHIQLTYFFNMEY